MTEPRLLVYSSLFPSPADPNAGVFIRERMFRVAGHFPMVVVSPKPWSPFDVLIRRFRPHFRPPAPRREMQSGITVLAPRFFSLPGVLKAWDSLFMALGSYATLRRLRREFGFNVIDAHFGYPDGHAASLLARWFKVPFAVTLRGSERTYAEIPAFRRRIAAGLKAARRVFAVSESLRRLALDLGVPEMKATAVGNAVDAERFHAVDRAAARARFGLPAEAKVLVTVGWLIERKGFHRVIACLPELLRQYPDLHYLVVGGCTGAECMQDELRRQVAELGLGGRVHFLGALAPDALKWPLSAADLFVLSSRREGWANVLLEAMACGLPVVASDVGGNAEVVCRPELGAIVPFGDHAALRDAIAARLARPADPAAPRAHAEANAWEQRVAVLCGAFRDMVNGRD